MERFSGQLPASFGMGGSFRHYLLLCGYCTGMLLAHLCMRVCVYVPQCCPARTSAYHDALIPPLPPLVWILHVWSFKYIYWLRDVYELENNPVLKRTADGLTYRRCVWLEVFAMRDLRAQPTWIVEEDITFMGRNTTTK